jgi:glycosyltransferase involved in cell wall biosynthesis
MIWLARNTAERLKMGLAGRSRAEQYFSWNQKVAALTKIYSEVLGGNSAAARGQRPQRAS